MRKLLLTVLLSATLLLPGCSATDPIEHVYVESITYTDSHWEELVVPANAVGEGWPAPGAGNAQSGYVYLFPRPALPTDELFLHFTFQMPHAWKEGTDITPNIRFIFNSDEVGTNVRWEIQYSWANIGDNFPVSTHRYGLSNPANNDSLKHQIVEFAPISGVGKKIGSTLMCFLDRSSDVSDNYTDTALFVSVGLLYQVDSPGSLSQWTK